MSLLRHYATARVLWTIRAVNILSDLQQLSIEVGKAMSDHPTQEQQDALVIAGQGLADATAALSRAILAVRSLT